MSSTGCLANNKIVIFCCAPDGCHNCTPTTISCPDTMVGMGTKDLITGNFTIPVTPLNCTTIYASDGCNDPAFQVGNPVPVRVPSVAPLLSANMIAALAAVLALVGLVGLSRLRLQR